MRTTAIPITEMTTMRAPPVPTDNMWKDLIGWCKEGDCIVLHVQNKAALIYHLCKDKQAETSGKNLKDIVSDLTKKIKETNLSTDDKNNLQDTVNDLTKKLEAATPAQTREGNEGVPGDQLGDLDDDLVKTRVIYLDCVNEPSMLSEEEGFPFYLEREKCHKCFCKVAKALHDRDLCKLFSDKHRFEIPDIYQH